MTADEDAGLVSALTVRARQLAGRPDASAELLSQRRNGVVVRVADVVVKAHSAATDPAELPVRLRLAGTPALDQVMLRPLPQPDGALVGRVAGRMVTAWPTGEPVDPKRPADAPWAEAGRLLATLHQAPAAPSSRSDAASPATSPVASPATIPGPPVADSTADHPRAGSPARVRRAITTLLDRADRHPAAATIRKAADTLPPWTYGDAPSPADRPRTLCHGDWHLGQLVRTPDGWRLVDVDDFGFGDPAWDLARPAAWYATGLMTPASWREFLDAYRGAGGPAVPARSDPWPALDAVARALVVQMTALAVVEATANGRALDEVEESLVETCRMIIAYGQPPDVR